ncbi:hypothetical protein [Paraburkholderia antibiotica]|uniref:hypothetical protein n=1 Tax=Paraburkholderia antibiotica TaxID=2728839 RepID=UPI001E369B07
MAPFFDGSSVEAGELVDGELGELAVDGESSWVLPPQALNSRAVAALRANASVVFFDESIFVSRFLINGGVINFCDFYGYVFNSSGKN